MLAPLVSARGLSVHQIPYDSVRHEIFRDTVFDRALPPVQLDILTYSNFERTTVGYELTLRDTELDIDGVELYVGDNQHKLNTLVPFSLHVGDASETNRIDRVSIWNKFPFDTLSVETDSLVIITDKGNFTLYLGEKLRRQKALKDQEDIFLQSQTETESTYMAWIAILSVLLVFAALVIIAINVRAKRRRDEVVNNLFIMSSDNERINTEHSKTVQSLFKQRFETLNKLCFEYFEKGDSLILRKSIYKEVEKEILRLREPSELERLEESLNKYCDNIMVKADSQLPGLSQSDRTLLVYLFSGLSARTICVLTDVEIKTFYMRRYRLKNKILAGDAPDKLLFAENM